MAEIALLDFNNGHPNVGCAALERAARSHGHVVGIIDVRGGQALPQGFDAVLTSGGPVSPLDQAEWASPLFAWFRQALEEQRPILAICFGFQMLCRAVGGKIFERKESRLGLYDLCPTEAGRQDPWLAAALPSAVFLQHRFGVQDLDGQVLASGAEGDVLAARFGPAAVGCMFHPEACPETTTAWLEDPGVQAKLEMRHSAVGWTDMIEKVPRLERSSRALLHGFLSCLD